MDPNCCISILAIITIFLFMPMLCWCFHIPWVCWPYITDPLIVICHFIYWWIPAAIFSFLQSSPFFFRCQCSCADAPATISLRSVDHLIVTCHSIYWWISISAIIIIFLSSDAFLSLFFPVVDLFKIQFQRISNFSHFWGIYVIQYP